MNILTTAGQVVKDGERYDRRMPRIQNVGVQLG